MNSIHPTAIVGPGVTLGEGNVIGAFAVIGGNVRLGDGNWIGAACIIGAPPEVRSHPHPVDWIAEAGVEGVRIGDRNVIREAVQVHGGWKAPTVIGDDGFIMNQVYIGHDGELGNHVTLASSVTLGGHVTIRDGANLGLGTNVHQRRVVGTLAMVGMSSVVTKDVPAFAKAYGSPCRVEGINVVGMERAGYAGDDIAWVREWIASGSPADAVPPAGISAALRGVGA